MDDQAESSLLTTPGGTMPRRHVLRLLGAPALALLAGMSRLGTTFAARHERHRRKSERHRNTARGKANSSTSANATRTLFRDDFHQGFDAASGSGNWFYFSSPPFVGNDGSETTGAHGLHVSAPQFDLTVAQDDPNGVPGRLDHVKWLVFANRFNGSFPGFAAEPGRELAVEATVSAQTVGTAQHPFGAAVTDPEDDLRLASAALNGIDFETFMVFDVFLTNKRIYAFYERLPFGRPQLGNYAAFSFQIPLMDRRPGDEHRLSIAYDRDAGRVRWLVDGKERFRVDQIGRLIDRQFMTLDHGGEPEDVAPKQLDFGMGLFTLLDGALPSGQALVRLSNEPNFYVDPSHGLPNPQAFVDEGSAPGSRLFGQGAEIAVERFTVQSRKASRT
jgi:hypothetical protein